MFGGLRRAGSSLTVCSRYDSVLRPSPSSYLRGTRPWNVKPCACRDTALFRAFRCRLRRCKAGHPPAPVGQVARAGASVPVLVFPRAGRSGYDREGELGNLSRRRDDKYRDGSRGLSRTRFHPTRLETRTKESSAYASRRRYTNPLGVSESEAHRTTEEALHVLEGRTLRARRHDPTCTGSARAGTRKTVNYSWSGRSRRKLRWKSVAILTCKSVV